MSMIITFHSIELDTDNYSLTRNGEELAVEPQVFNLITYLIEHSPNLVTRQQLLDDVWGGRIVTDASLSNHIKRARAVLGDTAENQTIIKTVRGRGYQFVATIDKTMPSTNAASSLDETQHLPLKEITTDTISHSHSPSPSPSPSKENPKSSTVATTLNSRFRTPFVIYSAGACALLILGFALFYTFIQPVPKSQSPVTVTTLNPLPSTPPISENNSIAVLPFKNRSNLDNDVFFTEGIHDDLLTQLSKVPNLNTISRLSVLTYKNSSLTPKQIGEELNVPILLEGGIQRAGDQIRINVQLINTKNNAHIWAETYTRKLTAENIFKIQTEIVTTIANQLELALSTEKKKQLNRVPTQNLAALEAWFKGQEYASLNTVDGRRIALQHFHRAIELDPNFAEVYAAIAILQMELIHHAAASSDDTIELVAPYVRKALELNNYSSKVYIAVAELEVAKENYAAAEAAYLKSIELNPNNVEAHSRYANMLTWRLRQGHKAIQYYQKSLRLNPNDRHAAQQLGEALMSVDRNAEAFAVLQSIVTKYPEDSLGHYSLGMFYSWALTKDDLAIQHLRKAIHLDPKNASLRWFLGEIYQMLGDKENTIFWLESMDKVAKDGESRPYFLGLLEKAKGNHEKAIDFFKHVKLQQASPASMALYEVGKDYIDKNDPIAAVELYLEKLPELNDPTTEINDYLFAYITGYAEALMAAGEKEKAENILRRAEPFIGIGGTAIDWYSENLALYWVLRGEENKAIDVMTEHHNQGKYFSFLSPELTYRKLSTVYEALKHNVKFLEFVDRFEHTRKTKLRNLEQWEAEGRLAAIPPTPVRNNMQTAQP